MAHSDQAVIAHTPVINWAVCLLLEFREREEGVVALHLPIEPLKTLLWVGACTEMQTQYLPAHEPMTQPQSHRGQFYILHAPSQVRIVHRPTTGWNEK